MIKQSNKHDIEKLLEIMATLRNPDRGCPWDREQTFATIAPYTIEEAYEVADAIERGALAELEGELGDLLFQTVFHARMAEEAGAFDFGGVVHGICDKLLRRHPHVFGPELGTGLGAELDSGFGAGLGAGLGAEPGAEPGVELGAMKTKEMAVQSRIWEEIKRKERGAAGETRVLADVPVALPALSRAAKLGKRAATVGFDWPDLAGVRAKLAEEIAELDAALAAAREARSLGRGAALAADDAGLGAATNAAVAAELGDVLFTVANLCRHLDLDPEACVRGANTRFEKRFDHVESEIRRDGGDWSKHDAAALDRLWERAKSVNG
jgi:nucleoside triphosphate diphosphatase